MSQALCQGTYVCTISDKCKRPECTESCETFRMMKAILDYDMVLFSPSKGIQR